ncbi:MAG TPA: hypothetical protein VF011_20725 [Terriglobales bacterium]
MLSSAARQSMSGSSPSVFLMISVGLTFAVVGLGLGLAAAYGSRNLRTRQPLQAENPAEPWMWREDWKQGRCNSRTKPAMIQAWAFAILCNLIASPTLFVIPRAMQQQPLAVLGFLFPLAGIGLLIRALRFTLAWLEFGVTWFEMTATPLAIGCEFRGNVQARFPHGADHGVRLKLSCVNRMVTGTGKSETVTEKILWRDEKSVSSAELCPGPLGTLIPVSFRVPWNSLPTDGSNPRNAILWLLEADADVPGVNYKDIFELPVFRTKDTPASPAAETIREQPAFTAPSQHTVVVTPTAEGSEFYFPAARNPRFAMGVTTFSMLWSGVVALIIYLHAPLIFPVVFGFFDLLLLTGAAQLWLATSRVKVDCSSIRVQTGLLGGGRWREYPKSQILDIQAVITAQQGGATGTPYYDIQLLQTEHQNVTLGRTIRDKDEAEWLVSEMRKALKLRAAAAAAGNSF